MRINDLLQEIKDEMEVRDFSLVTPDDLMCLAKSISALTEIIRQLTPSDKLEMPKHAVVEEKPEKGPVQTTMEVQAKYGNFEHGFIPHQPQSPVKEDRKEWWCMHMEFAEEYFRSAK